MPNRSKNLGQKGARYALFRVLGNFFFSRFVDAFVNIDTGLFIDPSRIRNDESSLLAQFAVSSMDSFAQELCIAVLSDDPFVRAKGLEMLSHLNETKETHLGMTQLGVEGKGTGEGLARQVWDSLNEVSLKYLVRLGVFSDLGVIPMFVKNFDCDRISDMVTAICKKSLVQFTLEQMKKHPQIAQAPVPFSYEYWDGNSKEWVQDIRLVPSIYGAPVLLVPQNWVGPDVALNSRRYNTVAVCEFLRKLAMGDAPEKRWPTKREFAKALGETIPENIRATKLASENGADLVWAFVKWAYRTLDGKRSHFRC